MEHSPTRLITSGPEPAAVRLYDRSADRQSHSDPLRFGGEKGSEQPICVLCIDSRSGIFDRYEKFAIGKRRIES